MSGQFNEVFEDFNTENVITVDLNQSIKPFETVKPVKNSRYYANLTVDPLITDRKTFFPRKVYWFYKNLFIQKKLFNKIEKIRKEKDIKVFIGVFGGVLPLVFYFEKKPRQAAVIFSDMDSWFVDVHSDMKKLWYRKYYSFNNALENSDLVDFLSPYILEGIKKRGVNLKDNKAVTAPCSFTDYSKCFPGDKTGFEVSFASRFEPNKNPLLFLEAVKKIHAEFPDVKFHMLGEGNLLHDVVNFITQNNLGSAVDLRFHPNPPEIFRKTSVFVSLQSNTNYPSQSVLEAMACGNAIIASNVGDTDLFINSSNGFLINLNADELTDILKKLILNPGLAANLGKAGREYAIKNHTIDKMGNYYIELIKRVHGMVFSGK